MSMKQKFGKVAVLMGGQCSEREVSLMSGEGALKALLKHDIDATAIDVGPDICEKLLKNNFDRAFIALHGLFGEDGTIQGMLEYLNIPYTGSAVLSSALAMDKVKTKLLWQRLGLATLPFQVIDEGTSFDDLLQAFGSNQPLCVKPSREGSSIGVFRVENEREYQHALSQAQQYQSEIMVEPWVQYKEVTVGILNDEALPVIRIKTPQGFYDYEAKYFSDETQFFIPSGLSDKQEQIIQDLSMAAYKSLDCRHWGRVDAVMDEHDNFYLLEVNTIPGLTSHSLVPQAAKAVGIEYDEMVIKILSETL